MLPALGSGRNFVCVVDAVVPDDQRTADHIDEVRPENEGRWRAKDVRQGDEQNDAGTHDGETYCQRSDHCGSLAKHPIEDKDQSPESQADSEARRRQQLNLLRWSPPQYGQCSHCASQEAGRDEQGSSSSRDDSTTTPAIEDDSSGTQGMPRP